MHRDCQPYWCDENWARAPDKVVKQCRNKQSVQAALRLTVSTLLFPNSNSFGVFSHSKGFGAELLSDSLWSSGADPSWAAKRFRLLKFCGKFTSLCKFRDPSGLGQIRFGAKRVVWKVPPSLL